MNKVKDKKILSFHIKKYTYLKEWLGMNESEGGGENKSIRF